MAQVQTKKQSAKATIIRKLNTYILFYKVALADDNHAVADSYRKLIDQLQEEAASINIDIEYNNETGRFRLKDKEFKESDSILVRVYHGKIASIVESEISVIETEKLRSEDRMKLLMQEAMKRKFTVDDSHYVVAITELQNSINKCEMQKEVLRNVYEKIQRIFE